jgi:hypothetical protein
MKLIVNSLNKPQQYTSGIAKLFYRNFNELIPKLNGIIFSGSNDGNVLVAYNKNIIIPQRFTIDGGKTWKNLLNKKLYLKSKNNEKNNTILTSLINRINAGDIILDKKNLVTDNIEKIIDNILPKNFNYLIESSEDKNKTIQLILKNNDINDLNYEVILSIYLFNKNPKEILDKLNDENKYDFFNLLFEGENFYETDFRNLRRNKENFENIIDSLISDDLFMKNFFKTYYYHLLYFTENKNKIINLLNFSQVYYSPLGRSVKKDIILNNERFRNEIDPKKLNDMLSDLDENIKRIKTLL